MVIRAVVWDLGGVLVRTEDFAPRQALARRFGMSRTELEDLVFSDGSGKRAQLGEVSIEQHWENLRQRFALTAEEMEDFREAFWGGDRVDLDLVDTIRALRTSYKTGLLSNGFSNLRQVVTEAWNFADAFDEMIISSEVGLVKPDPRIYRLALERLGVAAPEAVFLDDFPQNIEGARAVGMHAVHFQDRAQAQAELLEILDLARNS
jgi:epoxide hydrolase-like predicted phosphatase